METVKTIHEKLRKELSTYLKTQYFGKNNLLLNALSERLEEKGVLWQSPFVELPAAYKQAENGLFGLDLPKWIVDYFNNLADNNLGVFKMPFSHQIEALEHAYNGEDLFVSTGTGSGKTECFMWPLIAKLTTEAKNNPTMWNNTRGVRAIVMYPMNALVADQIGRLRRIIGTDKFLNIFRSTVGENSRRPQFGMYTGRTPYAGEKPEKTSDKDLANQLEYRLLPSDNNPIEIYEELLKEGKIPAKKNLERYIENLRNNKHFTDFDDAELISRFEMQNTCPDILITNYSMLEYMLLRPREDSIWNSTINWLNKDKENKLLFVIDEAHMYRGASGGEVSLLLRRLLTKLGINRDKVQFILTTASMPKETPEDEQSIRKFAKLLSTSDNETFHYIYGNIVRENTSVSITLPDDNYSIFDETNLLDSINAFLDGKVAPFSDISTASNWLYENIKKVDKFSDIYRICCGNASSIEEIASEIFPDISENDAVDSAYNALSIASYAINTKGESLFPIRLHMLFRGIKGLFACTNPNCKSGHSYDGFALGRIFTNDNVFKCPDCGSTVYELINDRRCGALYLKGYITEHSERAYLWRNSGLYFGKDMREIQLFIPQTDKVYPKKGKDPATICYLDSKSGFLYFGDDSVASRTGILKLYYSTHIDKNKPDVMTFATCPHCQHVLNKMSLTDFSTKGNQSFYNIVRSQFNVQSPVKGHEDTFKFPNEGRKVLLFSDSRQRAAKLALDMSQ
ncbi:MAG: DEAD/DEAH box helicase, partial [Oscillospiraceae bacterium]|nr:DEAD/DEAH box helicase [Oscillospiraceae bacterium]